MAADPKSSTPRPFDVTTIEHLIGLMARHDLSEITLAEGDHRIRLRKGGAVVMTAAPAAAPPAAAPPAPTAVAAPPAAAPAAKKLLEIKSEMVGTFFSKPSPDKPDFVTVGSKVTPATVVCMLGAMKIYDNVAAGVTGTIAEVCVKNDTPVDFGTVLFRVDPS